MRTQRGKVHDTREGDGPDIHGIDDIATVELEAVALDTWMGERSTKQRTDQKTIGQQIVQGETDILNNSDRVWDIGSMILKRYSKYTWGLAIVDVGSGLNAELHRGSHGQKREHRHGVGYDSPFDSLPPAIGGVKERGYTLEEHCDDDP